VLTSRLASAADLPPQDALAVLDELLQESPRHPEIQAARARSHVALGAPVKALEAYETANIENPALLGEIARAFEARKQYGKAYGLYARLADAAGSGTYLWNFRAGLMAERRDNAIAAVHWYRRAVTSQPTPVRTWFYLGRACQHAHDFGGAAYAFRRYADLMRKSGRSPRKDEGGLLDWGREIRFGATDRPAYAYGVYRACLLAKRLGIPAITVAELGVASGRGLLALVEHARRSEELTGVKVVVYGFDTGEGLPEPQDHRDVPHYFRAGDYAMKVDALKARLENCELILGDAGETTKAWIRDDLPPIGALFFDMDLYSSTMSVLNNVGDQADESKFLPRVSIYFDDVVPKNASQWLKDYGEHTGELQAIKDFNETNSATRLSQNRYFATFPEREPWHYCMYLMHRFSNPDYGTPVSAQKPDSLALP
jgi:tetratricopeptide (TPR) repeat protein